MPCVPTSAKTQCADLHVHSWEFISPGVLIKSHLLPGNAHPRLPPGNQCYPRVCRAEETRSLRSQATDFSPAPVTRRSCLHLRAWISRARIYYTDKPQAGGIMRKCPSTYAHQSPQEEFSCSSWIKEMRHHS